MSDMPDSPAIEAPEEEKATITLPGTVEKIIKPLHPALPEQAQIVVEGAEELYREIRIENTLTDNNGDKVKLKEGTEVEITVEAPLESTTPHSEDE
jgi:predicted DNA-binding antitoxin AbrB/MazE fold protein